MVDAQFNRRDPVKQDSVENVVDPNAHRQTTLNKRTTTSFFDQKRIAEVSKSGSKEVLQPTRDEVEAKIEASEARAETKFVEMRSDIRSISVQISAITSDVFMMRNDNKSTRTTVISAGTAFFGALIGVAAIASAFWYNGTVIFDHIHPR